MTISLLWQLNEVLTFCKTQSFAQSATLASQSIQFKIESTDKYDNKNIVSSTPENANKYLRVPLSDVRPVHNTSFCRKIEVHQVQ